VLRKGKLNNSITKLQLEEDKANEIIQTQTERANRDHNGKSEPKSGNESGSAIMQGPKETKLIAQRIGTRWRTGSQLEFPLLDRLNDSVSLSDRWSTINSKGSPKMHG
jgi:hypothetical protein